MKAVDLLYDWVMSVCDDEVTNKLKGCFSKFIEINETPIYRGMVMNDFNLSEMGRSYSQSYGVSYDFATTSLTQGDKIIIEIPKGLVRGLNVNKVYYTLLNNDLIGNKDAMKLMEIKDTISSEKEFIVVDFGNLEIDEMSEIGLLNNVCLIKMKGTDDGIK